MHLNMSWLIWLISLTPNTTSFKCCLPSTDSIDKREKFMKVHDRLMQARFIEIRQVFAKKRSDSLLTENYIYNTLIKYYRQRVIKEKTKGNVSAWRLSSTELTKCIGVIKFQNRFIEFRSSLWVKIRIMQISELNCITYCFILIFFWWIILVRLLVSGVTPLSTYLVICGWRSGSALGFFFKRE